LNRALPCRQQRKKAIFLTCNSKAGRSILVEEKNSHLEEGRLGNRGERDYHPFIGRREGESVWPQEEKKGRREGKKLEFLSDLNKQ